MALIMAELVVGAVKLGTLLGSIILLPVSFTPSRVGCHLRLASWFLAKQSNKGSPFSFSPWKWPFSFSWAWRNSPSPPTATGWLGCKRSRASNSSSGSEAEFGTSPSCESLTSRNLLKSAQSSLGTLADELLSSFPIKSHRVVLKQRMLSSLDDGPALAELTSRVWLVLAHDGGKAQAPTCCAPWIRLSFLSSTSGSLLPLECFLLRGGEEERWGEHWGVSRKSTDQTSVTITKHLQSQTGTEHRATILRLWKKLH